jgi:ubiquinol-cytochrome c reductase iron-sulfur subunit
MTEKVNESRRQFLVAATGLVSATGAAFVAVPFVGSWKPSEKAQAAGAPVDVDVSALAEGQMLTVEWRGKPVWVVRRSASALTGLTGVRDQLRDPDSAQSVQPVYATNEARAIKPEYLVMVGVCTHLGCAPLYKPNAGSISPDWQGGFFCPCHGSRFDLSGRVYKSVPAPTNLEVPPYYFLSDHLIRIGEHAQGVA